MRTFPLPFPSVRKPRHINFRARHTVGSQSSPLTLEQTQYVWPGDILMADISLPRMKTAAAEAWVGFLLALGGMEGSFVMGQLDAYNYAGARGSWAGDTVQVDGTHAAQARTLNVKNLTPFATGKAGDWLQLSSGSARRLHKVLLDFTADSLGKAAVDIFPRLRGALSNGDAVTLADPKGIWKLASNDIDWSIDLAQIYGINFSCIEDRTF
jgi:hypothetical protein